MVLFLGCSTLLRQSFEIIYLLFICCILLCCVVFYLIFPPGCATRVRHVKKEYSIGLIPWMQYVFCISHPFLFVCCFFLYCTLFVSTIIIALSIIITLCSTCGNMFSYFHIYIYMETLPPRPVWTVIPFLRDLMCPVHRCHPVTLLLWLALLLSPLGALPSPTIRLQTHLTNLYGILSCLLVPPFPRRIIVNLLPLLVHALLPLQAPPRLHPSLLYRSPPVTLPPNVCCCWVPPPTADRYSCVACLCSPSTTSSYIGCSSL